jgi:hypothetical protein
MDESLYTFLGVKARVIDLGEGRQFDDGILAPVGRLNEDILFQKEYNNPSKVVNLCGS